MDYWHANDIIKLLSSWLIHFHDQFSQHIISYSKLTPIIMWMSCLHWELIYLVSFSSFSLTVNQLVNNSLSWSIHSSLSQPKTFSLTGHQYVYNPFINWPKSHTSVVQFFLCPLTHPLLKCLSSQLYTLLYIDESTSHNMPTTILLA